jgi:two-component SAPR family response regulator
VGALAETVGGKYLEMEKISAAALAKNLHCAAADNYVVKPVTRYSLENSIARYLYFYIVPA